MKEKEDTLKKVKRFEEEFIKPLESKKDLEIAKEMSSKINSTYNKIKEEKFVISMFGSFSDGKSTIIKAITGQEDIEIAPIPTTDKVKEYNYEETFKIVDTPGLFSENYIHSEITKKYISEANLIIYIMEPVNPIKDSQLNSVKWLLKDLNKIDSTIFVINKMDDVADIEDTIEFQKEAKMKIKVVGNTINKLGLNFKNENIIAISADPYGEGLDYWKNNLKEYKDISRIEELTNKIEEFTNNHRERLILKVANSVLNDCIGQLEKDLIKYLETKKSIIEVEKKDLEYSIEKFSQFKNDVSNSFENISNKIEELRKEYLTEISNVTDNKQFNTFFELYIGEDYYVLQDKVENTIRKETEYLLDIQKTVILDINRTAQAYENKKSKILEMSGSLGGKFSKSINFIPIDKLRNGIKVFRDTTGIPIKFKPWGIIKLSERLKFGGAFLGAGIEAFETFSETNKKNKLESLINKQSKELSECFKEIKSELSYENYIESYFPSILEFYNNKENKVEYIEKEEIENKELKGLLNELSNFKKTLG
ncbi:LeoA/HP0731 family dynamin-like GTPase [Staphylococcus equorum]